MTCAAIQTPLLITTFFSVARQMSITGNWCHSYDAETSIDYYWQQKGTTGDKDLWPLLCPVSKL